MTLPSPGCQHSLTKPIARPDNGRSLKNKGSTPAHLLRSRVFCAPYSGGSRFHAGRYPSMGVSGSRKAPDVPLYVESTPTPFRVVINLKKQRRLYA